jgi:hypothetical protein
MKKQVKKLVLSKETMRRLVTFDLMGVAGGTSIGNMSYSCPDLAKFCVEEPIC